MKLVYFAPEVETLHLTSRTEILQASADSMSTLAIPELENADMPSGLWD